jgi:hypothetical protein
MRSFRFTTSLIFTWIKETYHFLNLFGMSHNSIISIRINNKYGSKVTETVSLELWSLHVIFMLMTYSKLLCFLARRYDYYSQMSFSILNLNILESRISGIAVGVAIILVRLEAMWFLVTNKRYPKNIKEQVNCNSCKWLISL